MNCCSGDVMERYLDSRVLVVEKKKIVDGIICSVAET
jgi:hypothetical protein